MRGLPLCEGLIEPTGIVGQSILTQNFSTPVL